MLKRVIFVFAIFVFVLSSVSVLPAQDEKPKLNDRVKQRIDTRLENMTKELSLKPDQVKKVEEILVANALAAPAFDRSRMRDMSREERMDMMQKMRENREETNKKIEKILTADQVKKFKAFVEKENSRRRGRRGRRG